jgi:hypothetical protein
LPHSILSLQKKTTTQCSGKFNKSLKKIFQFHFTSLKHRREKEQKKIGFSTQENHKTRMTTTRNFLLGFFDNSFATTVHQHHIKRALQAVFFSNKEETSASRPSSYHIEWKEGT